MAKSKTTVAQGYYHGEAEIASFMKSEIGTEKEARARMEKMQKKALEKLDGTPDKKQMDKLMDYLSVASKVKHHQYYNSFNEYSTMMHKYLDPKKGTLSPEELDNIIQKSKEVRFHKLFSNKELKWKSESGIKAIGKYATLLAENDFRKFSFYKTCISQSADRLKMADLLTAATPVRYQINEGQIEIFAKEMKKLEEKLKKTEGFHVNSAEYDRMKKAIKAVNQAFKEGTTYDKLGERFEELQAASMDYITDKGVGKQSTQRGIDRMDAALDICRISAAGMDYFMSKERAKEVQDFQKKHFDVYFAYKDADKEVKPVTSVYEAKEEKKIEAEMDDGAMSR